MSSNLSPFGKVLSVTCPRKAGGVRKIAIKTASGNNLRQSLILDQKLISYDHIGIELVVVLLLVGATSSKKPNTRLRRFKKSDRDEIWQVNTHRPIEFDF